jgi:hypothetical protein
MVTRRMTGGFRGLSPCVGTAAIRWTTSSGAHSPKMGGDEDAQDEHRGVPGDDRRTPRCRRRMSWCVTYRDSLRADLDIAGPELFQRAGDAVRAFAERGEGKAYPVDVDSSVWTFFVPGGLSGAHASPVCATCSA